MDLGRDLGCLRVLGEYGGDWEVGISSSRLWFTLDCLCSCFMAWDKEFIGFVGRGKPKKVKKEDANGDCT